MTAEDSRPAKPPIVDRATWQAQVDTLLKGKESELLEV